VSNEQTEKRASYKGNSVSGHQEQGRKVKIQEFHSKNVEFQASFPGKKERKRSTWQKTNGIRIN
jgi:hypothetical protein